MNFHSERPNRENGTTFSEFPFVPGIFQWKQRNKISTFAPKIWWSAAKLQRLVPKQVIFRITFRLNSVIVLLPNVGFAVASAQIFSPGKHIKLSIELELAGSKII